MKKISFLVSVLAGLLFYSCAASADTNVLPSKDYLLDFRVSGDMSYWTKYVGGGTGAVAYDNLVLQGGLYVNHVSGMWSGMSFSYSPWDVGNDFGDEGDFYLGYQHQYAGISYGVNYGFYNLVGSGDLHDLVAGVSIPELWLGVTPYVRLSWTIPTREEIVAGGLSYKIGVTREHSIDGQDFTAGLSVGGHDGVAGKKPEMVSWARLSLDFLVEVFPPVVVTVHFQKGLGYEPHDGGFSGNEVWGGITYIF